jgi:DNA-binding CsgD family transcriptional regulator/catechol 2,3-dioxygenase-like lactoylglutathione lyase family enzyme
MSSRGRPPHPDVLTPAEWRVVEAVRHGLGNAAIARRLGVSTDAIKFHVANALDKLGLARRTDLRAWDGIARSSALHPRETSMTGSDTLGPIGQVARSVRDIEAARQWYGGVLGLPHLYSFGNLAFFDCGGVRLFLSEGDGADGASILYFRVADIHATKARLESRGVAFHGAPHLIHRHADGTEEWMAFFKDPEERPLALMAQVPPSRPPA